jgi:hypothetical protein
VDTNSSVCRKTEERSASPYGNDRTGAFEQRPPLPLPPNSLSGARKREPDVFFLHRDRDFSGNKRYFMSIKKRCHPCCHTRESGYPLAISTLSQKIDFRFRGNDKISRRSNKRTDR